MSNLNVDQKTVKSLFQEPKTDFLIPDYQRPYAWTEVECQTLWDDLFSFAFPNDDSSQFDSDEEYFLGPIVTFRNDRKQKEVIDGQQRLTTLMLLLRAFYERFGNMQDKNSLTTKQNIEHCIWKSDEYGNPDMDALKIDSEVATDNDKDEFLTILRTGVVTDKQKSTYASNYRFFQKKINDFLNDYPSYFALFPTRILNNCILLPIEAESQNTALRIFSTLNDRGKPLSDSDIFKAQFYSYYNAQGKKDEFIARWRDLEELCERIFHPITGTPMDELFTRYMYFERAKQGNKSSTTEALRKFYEKNSYSLLKKESTFENLVQLADFWDDVSKQNEDRFSDKVLKRLFVLNYAPNGMWTYFVSVYFMTNKDDEGKLNDERFYRFLLNMTAFVWAYAVTNPGVNALRTPIFAEMANIVNGQDVTYADYKFDRETTRSAFEIYSFTNVRPITKSMLAWWAFQNPNQALIPLDTVFEIEHIFPKSRQDKDKSLSDSKKLEFLGNKSMLEKRINIRASDYRFDDKKKYYRGYTNNRNQKKEATQINELISLTYESEDFTETEIDARNRKILDSFMDFLAACNLLK